MKSGKATGVCGIPAELLKADGDTVQRELQYKKLEFMRGKGKGDHRECGSHRRVTPSQRPAAVCGPLTGKDTKPP